MAVTVLHHSLPFLAESACVLDLQGLRGQPELASCAITPLCMSVCAKSQEARSYI